MADNNQMLLYAAAYDTVEAALADMDAVEQLHKDKMIGKYDAAVIDQQDPAGLFGQAVRVKSSRARWLDLVRSRGWPVQ